MKRIIKRDVKYLAFIVSILILIGLLGWISGVVAAFYQRNQTLSNIESQLKQSTRLRIDALSRQIEAKRRDVLFLVGTPPVPGIVRASLNQGYDAKENSPIALWKQRLETIFISFLKTHPALTQLRYIGEGDEGRELVRVNKRFGATEVVAKEQLQTKGHRDYFKATSRLKPGEVYISDVSLNRERGELELPYGATTQFGTPVFDDKNRFFGMLVMGVDMDFYFKTIETQSDEPISLFISNAKGDFLYHPNHAKRFGFEFKTPWRWTDEFKKIKSLLAFPDVGLYQSSQGNVLINTATMRLNENEPDSAITITSVMSESLLQREVRATQWQVMKVTWLGTSILGLLVFLYFRKKWHTSEREAQRAKDLNKRLEKIVQARTKEIQRYSEFQKAILNNAGSAIIATDTTGVISLFNPTAETMLGYQAQEMIGKKTPAIFHEKQEIQQRAKEFSKELNRSIDPGFEVFVIKSRLGILNEHIWTYVRKDGRTFPVWLSITALRNTFGEIYGFLGVASDISQLEETKSNLRKTRDQLVKLAKVAQMGIWSWDISSNELVWNERMFEMYDYLPNLQNESVLFSHWQDRIVQDDLSTTITKLNEAIEHHKPFDATFRIQLPSGKIRHIQAVAFVEYMNDKPHRMVGINIDISAQKELEQRLQEAKVAAEQISHAKSEFVANMSHEIRTPMHAILGMLQLLKRTELNAQQVDYTSKAEIAGRSMLQLLNDILDFSKIEAGKLVIDIERFNLNELMRELALMLSTQANKKGVEVLFDIGFNLPAWLFGDPLRLKQVLLNLCGNALKFTEHGEVVLTVKVIEQSIKHITLHFSIKDTGIGISRAHCQKIFEGFVQAETSMTRRYGGTGLGLAISQRLVNLMGGEINVQSELGKGSVFGFSLPFKMAKHNVKIERSSVKVSIKNLQCLVIDDNDNARIILKSMLHHFGWEVAVASDGDMALSMIKAQAETNRPFDVVFVDWLMPGMSGYAFIETIESLKLKPHPIILIITALDQELIYDRQDDFLKESIDSILSKPVTASMVFDAVVDAYEKRQASKRIKKKVKTKQTSPLAGLVLLLVEDNRTNQQVAFELLRQEGATVIVANDGYEAVERIKQVNVTFDAVLMDLQMPRMNGFEATHAIRDELGHKNLCIIAMTANASKADKEAALKAGMNDHVGKPFDIKQLIKTVLKHTKDLRQESLIEEQSRDVHRNHQQRLNTKEALQRFKSNTRVYRKAVHHFMNDLQQLLKELPSKLTPSNKAKTLNTLHTMKGVAATIGAELLSTQAKDMELQISESKKEMDYATILGELMNESKVTLEQCRRYLNKSREENTSSTQSMGKGEFVDLLKELSQLLERHSFDASNLFQKMTPLVEMFEVDDLWEKLDEAINQFDFNKATDYCHQILEVLNTQ